MEWFDFAIYGYLAVPLSQAFFPQDNSQLQLLSTFGVFAVGFLMRPIGSLVLGPLGDLIGRRFLLSASLYLMGLSSLLIACLPNYDSWGWRAPMALTILRMVQGFSVGGEFTGSIAFNAETAPRGKRCLVCSLTSAGAQLGFSLAALSAGLSAWWFGGSPNAEWIWRLPFLLGSGVVLLAVWMQRRLPESLGSSRTDTWRQLNAAVVERLQELVTRWRLVLKVMALVGFTNVVFYLAMVFLVDFSVRQSGEAAAANANASAIQTGGVLVVMASGALADRFGLLRINRWGNVAALLLVVPALWLGLQGTVLNMTIALLLLVVPLMMVLGTQGLLGALLVPSRERCAVFSLAYSLSVALFGGTAPLLAGWLIEKEAVHWLLFYPMPMGVLCLFALSRSQSQIAREECKPWETALRCASFRELHAELLPSWGCENSGESGQFDRLEAFASVNGTGFHSTRARCSWSATTRTRQFKV